MSFWGLSSVSQKAAVMAIVIIMRATFVLFVLLLFYDRKCLIWRPVAVNIIRTSTQLSVHSSQGLIVFTSCRNSVNLNSIEVYYYSTLLLF